MPEVGSALQVSIANDASKCGGTRDRIVIHQRVRVLAAVDDSSSATSTT